MSIAAATADVRAAMAQLEAAYFALQRQVAASVGSPVYPEVQVACDVARQAFGFGPLELVGRQRTEAVCWARHVAMWLVHEHGRMNAGQIGESFGGRDHGTVDNAVKRVRNAMETDAARAEVLKRLQAAFVAEMKRKELI